MSNRAIIKIVLTMVGITMIGVFGYMLIEGWSFNDSIYMTIITLTTAGYEEVNELSIAGRYFTIFLLCCGVASIAYFTSEFIQQLADDLKSRGTRKMHKKIDALEGHTVVLGFGRMGRSFCAELELLKVEFVVIEQNEHLLEQLEERGYLHIRGNAADDKNLLTAGICKAKTLVSVIDKEADSLFSAIAAKSLNSNITVVVRADSENSERRMKMAGADRVVLPFVMSGKKLAQQLTKPLLEDFLDMGGLNEGEESRLQVMDIPIAADSELVGQSLATCGLRREGLMVVGIKNNHHFEFAPDATRPFKAGETLVTIGTPSSFELTKNMLKIAI